VRIEWPLPNGWLGGSVENQSTLDERVSELLQTPAVVRFLSCEPLLSHVDISAYLADHEWETGTPGGVSWVIVGGESGPGARPCHVEWIRSVVRQCAAASVPCFVKQLGAQPYDANDAGYDGVEDWEWPHETRTGPSLAHQGAANPIYLNDRAGSDPEEWPADLRVRQMPTLEPGA